jgi:cysteine desulfuration protein SufE
MTIQQIQEQIINEFSVYNDWMGRYTYLIELGKQLPELSQNLKQDKYLIRGCVSKVWLVPSMVNGRLFFKADADALIARGIVAIMLRCFSGQTPSDLLRSDMEFVKFIGMTENLSPSRNNGMNSMYEKIRFYAKQNSHEH